MDLPSFARLGKAGRPPWNPITVTVITFFLPLGGIVLAIRNLERMGQLDQAGARQLALVSTAICAIGMTTLITAAEWGAHGRVSADSSAAAILSVGLTAAAFAVQRGPYRKWRASHPVGAAESWLRGLLVSLAYTLLVVAIALPLQTVVIAVLAAIGQGVT